MILVGLLLNVFKTLFNIQALCIPESERDSVKYQLMHNIPLEWSIEWRIKKNNMYFTEQIINQSNNVRFFVKSNTYRLTRHNSGCNILYCTFNLVRHLYELRL